MNYKILIDENNLLPNNFKNNEKLLKINNYLGLEILIEKKTYTMYQKLKNDLIKNNINIDINQALKNEGEYQTGLAIEIVLKENNNYLKLSDIDKNKLKKIHSSLSRYGFILRNIKNKPSYIRYVGKSTAEIIYNNNITLEEYHKKYNRSGIIIVNKPSGMTSRDVDEVISKKFDTRKVGHTGTLDPLASGVLIVTINQATRISENITSNDKEYIATVKLGIETDSLDITGKVIKEEKYSPIKNLAEVLKSFEKTYLQEVPIYSAVKVNGKKLYEYARNNEKVKLPKKEVTIKKIELLNKTDDTFTFKCVVSKGTYIRSLIRDIGNSINIPMTMQSLIRTKEAKYSLEDSNTLEEIINDNYKIIPIEETLEYPVISIEKEILFKVKNGAVIPNIYNINDRVVFKNNQKLIAIYEVTEDKKNLKSYKNFSL